MGHPIFQDAPSRDMTKAQERQETLDAQVEAFLAKGGQIKAYDTLRRPIEQNEWGNFSIKPCPPAPRAEQKTEPAPVPAPPAEVVEVQQLAVEVFPQDPAPAPVEIQLARNLTDEVVLVTIPVPVPVPVPKAIDVSKELKAMRRELAAVARRLDRMSRSAEGRV